MKVPQKGFTLVELIVIVVIVAIIAAIALSAFSKYAQRQGLHSSQRIVRSALEEARSKTLSSEGGGQYGIHITIGSSTITLFQGNTYSEMSSTNKIVPLDKRVKILEFQDLALYESEDIITERLTGTLSATGTIVLSLIGDDSATTGITAHETGITSDGE